MSGQYRAEAVRTAQPPDRLSAEARLWVQASAYAAFILTPPLSPAAEEVFLAAKGSLILEARL